MTVRPAPGSPKLVIDDEPEQDGAPLSDSYVPELEEEAQVQENLGRIARAKRNAT